MSVVDDEDVERIIDAIDGVAASVSKSTEEFQGGFEHIVYAALAMHALLTRGADPANVADSAHGIAKAMTEWRPRSR